MLGKEAPCDRFHGKRRKIISTVRKQITPATRYLILALTDECNLRCLYCYRGEPEAKQSMSRKTAGKSLRFAAASGKAFHVQMTGGEPALVPEMIEWTSSQIRSVGRPATIAVQTNGTLLDRALIKYLKRYDVQVGISLDGTPAVQEKLRGRAAETIRGMKLLSDANMEFRVTAVVTRQNVKHLHDLALFLAAFPGCRGLGLDMLVNRGRAAASKTVAAPLPEALKTGVIRLTETLRRINRRRSVPIQLREWERIKGRRVRGASDYCHACRGESLAVLPDGTLFPCSQTAGDPAFACGTVDAPDTSKITALSGLTLRGEQCGGCLLASYCPGDCPSRLYYNGIQNSRLACVMYQTLWQEYTRSLQ
ncbi:MAG: radical SAM protein [Deltaproteobacteria bacterium]|nr:MAG: radical SAM protein [Deltaproteobacteria bacterium]